MHSPLRPITLIMCKSAVALPCCTHTRLSEPSLSLFFIFLSFFCFLIGGCSWHPANGTRNREPVVKDGTIERTGLIDPMTATAGMVKPPGSVNMRSSTGHLWPGVLAKRPERMRRERRPLAQTPDPYDRIPVTGGALALFYSFFLNLPGV